MPDPAPAAEPAALPIDNIPSTSEPDFFSSIEAHFQDPKPEPEPAPEPKPEPADPEPPATSRPASLKAKDFELIKTQRDEARTKATELETTLAELKAKLAEAESGTTELASLREQYAAAQKDLHAVNVQKSPEYQKLIVEPGNKVRNEIMRLATKYKLDQSKLIDVLAESDPSAQTDLASDIAGSMNQRDQFLLYQLVDDFNALEVKRAELHTNAEKAWQEILSSREQEQTKAAAAAKKAWTDAEAKVWAAVEKKVPGAADIPEVQKLRNQVAARQISELTPEEQAYSSLAGHLLPHYVKQAASAEAKIRELEAALSKFTQATPGAGTGNASESSTSEPDFSEGGFLANIERKLAGA